MPCGWSKSTTGSFTLAPALVSYRKYVHDALRIDATHEEVRNIARREPAVRDTRGRVLAAALESFVARGHYGASIEGISVRAGMTKEAVYYWFSDKGDQAFDLQRDLWDRLADQAQAAADPDAAAVENLKSALRAFLDGLSHLDSARFTLRDYWGGGVGPAPTTGKRRRSGRAALGAWGRAW